MRPVRLALRDFLSYTEPPPLEFEGFDIACLTGDNGVGKSALLDAITYALFGAARGCEGGQFQDRLIRDGAEEMSVDFVFDLGSSRYRIVRQRSRAGKGDVRFLVEDGDDWRNIAGQSLRETDALIASTLRLDYKTFTASAFFLQGRADDFLSMAADQRKDVFARLLELGVYEELEEAARDRARACERERTANEARAAELMTRARDAEAIAAQMRSAAEGATAAEREANLAHQAAEEHRGRVSELEKFEALLIRDKDAIRDLEAQLKDAIGTQKKFEAEIAQLESAEAQLTKIRLSLEELGDPFSALEKVTEDVQVCRGEEARITEQLRTLTASAKEYEEKLDLLAGGGGECPVCGSRLDGDHRTRVERDLKGRLETVVRNGRTARSESERLHKEALRCEEEVRRLRNASREREGLVAARDSLDARLERLPSLRVALVEAAARVQEKTNSLEDHRAALSEREGSIAGLAESREALRAVLRKEEDLRKVAAVAGEELARLEERLGVARQAAADLEEARAAEQSYATDHRRYRRLAEAFGRGGIPDRIIDNARPALEDDANEILGRLTDYEMTVHFQMQRQTRSGKARDTFDVLVHHDSGLPRDFAMFSGGEAFRIAFAVRLALSKLLVRRAGARVETLVIDEGFGTQDPQGRERLVQAINLAREEFAKVLVITHLDDLKDLLGAQIQVTKDPARGSVIEVLGA